MTAQEERTIVSIPGYDRVCGFLANQISCTRHSTVHLLTNLSVKQLDFRNEFFENSIAKLVMHIAAMEHVYYFNLRGMEMPNSEMAFWKPFFSEELRNVDALCKEQQYYKEILNTSSQLSLSLLKTNDDDWLFKKKDFNGMPFNFAYYFFHRLEDEARHQGQMRLILKQLAKDYRPNVI